MKQLEIKTLILLMVKGLIQLLQIIASYVIPVLIAIYFYALVTGICDLMFRPDFSINYEALAGLIFPFPIVLPIVVTIILVIGGAVYFLIKLIVSSIQTVLSILLLNIEKSLGNDSILDSQMTKYVIVFIAEAIGAFLLYSFFAKYDFNMNTFCYAIGGSAAFGDLIDLNEQFKMISFYLTMVVMMGTAFYYIKKNYITTY